MLASSRPKRALITGITGQDGSYLAELLIGKGYQVWGMVRRASSRNTPRIDHLLDREDGVRLVTGDLGDALSMHQILRDTQPHEVYNLGAQSHVQVSFELPTYTGDITGLGTVRLLESIRQLGLETRFYQASSSELYGKVRETPQNERTPFHPRSPYAAAKALAFFATANYREAYGAFATNGILFNHESPRRGETFVTRKITRAAAAMRSGKQERLRLGNLDASRDWGFAGDYVEAMWLILQAQEPDDFVVATGETHTVREFCELAFAHAGLPVRWQGRGVDEQGIASDGRVLVDVDPALFRPAEVDLLVGDSSKAREVLGWRPKMGFAELVASMVDADIEATGDRITTVTPGS